MSDKIEVLGIPISNNSKVQVSNLIKHRVVSSRLFISTVNASFVIKAQKDSDFYSILKHKTDLNLADGVSIQLAAEYLHLLPKISHFKSLFYLFHGLKIGLRFALNKKFTILKHRVTGVYLTKKLIDLATKNNWVVIVLHREDGLTTLEELKNYLYNTYTGLNFKVIGVDLKNKSTSYNLPDKIDLCFCTLGEVYQEKVLNSICSTRTHGVYVGVGSSFDVLIGKVSPIKTDIQDRGLEWLFRLIKRPKRVKKVIRSVIYFPLIVYKYSLSHTK